jgi:DNA polymerase-3 subunit beta
VSTISSERGRAVKLAIADGQLTLTVNNPDSGSATEELAVGYERDPIEIGFNAKYLLDITNQLSGNGCGVHARRSRFSDTGARHRRR